MIDQHEYLIHLCRYIHLNPVETGLVKDIKEWKYSNYLEFIGERKGSLVDKQFIKDIFGHGRSYEDFVVGYIEEKEKYQEIEKYLLE